jgi:hypothetical protein
VAQQRKALEQAAVESVVGIVAGVVARAAVVEELEDCVSVGRCFGVSVCLELRGLLRGETLASQGG